jgi:hypothetical protein
MSAVEQTPEADVSYTQLTIQGLAFEISQPYSVGHVLTIGEASQLNQVRAENIRNNFASVVRGAIEAYRKANSLPDDAEVPLSELDKDELDAKLGKYDEEYVMGVRGGPSGPRIPVDPVQREAYRIGTDKVKMALKKKNISLNSVPKEKFDEYVKGVVNKYPEILEEARRRVNAGAEITLADL